MNFVVGHVNKQFKLAIRPDPFEGMVSNGPELSEGELAQFDDLKKLTLGHLLNDIVNGKTLQLLVDATAMAVRSGLRSNLKPDRILTIMDNLTTVVEESEPQDQQEMDPEEMYREHDIDCTQITD